MALAVRWSDSQCRQRGRGGTFRLLAVTGKQLLQTQPPAASKQPTPSHLHSDRLTVKSIVMDSAALICICALVRNLQWSDKSPIAGSSWAITSQVVVRRTLFPPRRTIGLAGTDRVPTGQAGSYTATKG